MGNLENYKSPTFWISENLAGTFWIDLEHRLREAIYDYAFEVRKDNSIAECVAQFRQVNDLEVARYLEASKDPTVAKFGTEVRSYCGCEAMRRALAGALGRLDGVMW